jgi:predicted ArsR family transcriptional regulator
MTPDEWQRRLRESTRGRVLALLRRAPRTVSELAGDVGLSANAVRLHLSGLERDRLVERHGTRQEWTGKPACVYRTVPAAEALYPKPYALLLSEVLRVLGERQGGQQVTSVLRAVGERLGKARASASPDLRARLEAAAAVLTELGGLAEVEAEPGGYRLQGYSCPLAELTVAHPVACRLAESLVGGVVGVPVQECCERGERPRCAFRVAAD